MNKEELLIKKQEDYIKIAKEKHNNKYDYSLVKYIGAKIKVKIICPEHGIFEQDLYKHSIMSYSCKQCSQKIISDKQRTGLNEFIKKAKETHGDMYNYDNVQYTNNKKKVNIYCNKHKKNFLQSPDKHVNSKQGCPTCKYDKIAKTNTKVNEHFLLELKKIHGNKYDFSKVHYEGAHDKVTIICKLHGEFYMTPTHLLSRKECAKCKNVYRCSKEEFIELANKKYNNKYEYYADNYSKKSDKIKIKCKIHNIIFEQTATGHLLYEGCSKCLPIVKEKIYFFKRGYDYILLKYNGLQEKY